MAGNDTPTTGDSSRDLSDDVEAALRDVRDPEVDVTVFEAGLIEDVRIDGGDVTIEADLSDFAAEGGRTLTSAIVRSVQAVEGVERVHVEHARQGRTSGETVLADVDRIVAVASAKGGVGKSTVAANLACALAADEDVGLFDADIHGPNVPGLLGASGPVYSDDDGNPLPVGVRGAGATLEVMSVGLMQDGAPLAWRGAMAHDALTELFEETAWDEPDTLVIDLPPGTGDVVLTTLQEVPVDGVVVVTTPFHAAVTDTRRSVELFRENDVPVLGVVVNMESFRCRSCGEEHALFPEDSPIEELDVPSLAEVPFTADLQGTPTPGDPPGSMADLAERVEERYAEVWDVSVPEGALDLRGVPPEARRTRVREAFASVEVGGTVEIVSDRDPSPVQGYLAEEFGTEAGRPPLGKVRVRQQNPETWFFRGERTR